MQALRQHLMRAQERTRHDRMARGLRKQHLQDTQACITFTIIPGYYHHYYHYPLIVPSLFTTTTVTITRVLSAVWWVHSPV